MPHGNIYSNAFVCADDLILLTPCSVMRKLIQTCEEYAIEYDLRFNPSKCRFIIFADSGLNSDRILITIFDNDKKYIRSPLAI